MDFTNEQINKLSTEVLIPLSTIDLVQKPYYDVFHKVNKSNNSINYEELRYFPRAEELLKNKNFEVYQEWENCKKSFLKYRDDIKSYKIDINKKIENIMKEKYPTLTKTEEFIQTPNSYSMMIINDLVWDYYFEENSTLHNKDNFYMYKKSNGYSLQWRIPKSQSLSDLEILLSDKEQDVNIEEFIANMLIICKNPEISKQFNSLLSQEQNLKNSIQEFKKKIVNVVDDIELGF